MDQYAEMLFIINNANMGDEDAWKQLTQRLPSRLSTEWKNYCDMDLHTQLFLQILSCFNVDNMMDLIEKKVGSSGKQTMRKKLRSLLQ